MTAKRYKSAPITEAVIEIRIAPPPTVDHAALENLAAVLKSEFPNQAPMNLVELGIAISPQKQNTLDQTMSQKPMGFRLSKASDSRILQLRRDALAYSHMAPYTQWSRFRDEARPLWEKYRTVYGDAKPTRCALRYINRVDIPGTSIEIEDYFALYPQVSKKLPQQDIVGMTLNLQMPQADLECMASITQAQVAPVKPDHLSFILDIDVFRLGIETWSDSDIWTYLDRLRERKNEIFEGCITDRIRGLIDS